MPKKEAEVELIADEELAAKLKERRRTEHRNALAST